MSALTFDKGQLGNLEYSLKREMLATDRRGGYMSTTIVGCNTRKYHGLMVAPIDESERTCILLSSLDETIVQHDQSFNLALHRYRGVYEPRGHKYITDFKYTPCPTITYRVGGVILRKELLWIHKRTQLMIRYTLVDAHSQTKLRLRPFFAYRDKHTLTHANMEADGRSYPVTCGVKCRLYEGYPWLYLQTNRPDAEFIAAPDWYYDFEYSEELIRGYEGHEDLLTTGYFEVEIKKGESVIFSASTEEMKDCNSITEFYDASIDRRTHKIDLHSCLQHAARQLVIRRPGNRTEMMAGYPWHGTDGRVTFMALPGITLEQGHKEDCIDVLDTMVGDMRNGDFAGSASAYREADAPLWFFWTLQNLEKHIGAKEIWSRYGTAMKEVLEAYRRGFGGKVVLHDNGLIWAWDDERPLTWMNTQLDGHALIPRRGYAIEINALWYNAVSYAVALASKCGDKEFAARWKGMPAKTKASFMEKFMSSNEIYPADFVNDNGADMSIRPNMIVAFGLDYTMFDEEQMFDMVLTVRQHLLTRRGLRTLTPLHPDYDSGEYEDWISREKARMNGAVWVWPLIFYVRTGFRLRGEDFIQTAREIVDGFEEELTSGCIGSLAEYHEPDPPFDPRGAVSSALSVSAILQIIDIIAQYEKPKKRTKRSTAAKAETKAESAKAEKAEKAVKSEAEAKAVKAAKSAKTVAKAAKSATKTATKSAAKRAKKEDK